VSTPDPMPDDIPATEAITDRDLGSTGVSSTQNDSNVPFKDTFFGPRDKKYLDFIARRTTKLRGTYAQYYILRSQTQRTDGAVPVSVNPRVGPFDQIRHAGDGEEGVSAMYGETIRMGPRLSSTERETAPTWDFNEPVLVRGIVYDPERSETPDERGSIYVHRIRIALARVLCEETWKIRPQIGDMVRFPELTNPGLNQDYYDVEEVVINDTRFGSTGFFTAFTLQLSRSSRFSPERKLPSSHLTEPPEPPV